MKKIKSIKPRVSRVDTKTLARVPNKAFQNVRIKGMKTTYLDEYNRLQSELDSISKEPNSLKNKAKIIELVKLKDDLYGYQAEQLYDTKLADGGYIKTSKGRQGARAARGAMNKVAKDYMFPVAGTALSLYGAPALMLAKNSGQIIMTAAGPAILAGANHLKNKNNRPKFKNELKPITVTPEKHAYGDKIEPKFNAGDFGTIGLDMGSGALSGFMVGGPIGAAIGGILGLGKGIIGSKGRATARANALEANRQQTINNMNMRIDADSMNSNLKYKAPGFYMNGGMLRRRHAGGGLVPISSDSQLAIGPSHEQGGMDISPQHEIEGGEVMEQEMDGTRVFSDRLLVRGTDKTYAEVSAEILKQKGKFEKQLQAIQKDVDKEHKESTKVNNNVLKINSAKRRAQIGLMKADEIAAKIKELDNATTELFAMQQEDNGEGTGEEMANGGFMYNTQKLINDQLKFNIENNIRDNLSFDKTYRYNKNLPEISENVFKGDNTSGFNNLAKTYSANGKPLYSGFEQGLGIQFGADVLDTASQAIIASQMAKMPVPTRSLVAAPKLNTYFDNSEELSSIDSQAASARKFIKDNTRGAGTRRANFIAMMNRVNSAKNSSYANKGRIERGLENENVMLNYRNRQMNNEIAFSNKMDAYNATQKAYSDASMIASNFADKMANLGIARAEQDVNSMSFAAILAQYPADVRRGIIMSMRKGKSMRESLLENVGK